MPCFDIIGCLCEPPSALSPHTADACDLLRTGRLYLFNSSVSNQCDYILLADAQSLFKWSHRALDARYDPWPCSCFSGWKIFMQRYKMGCRRPCAITLTLMLSKVLEEEKNVSSKSSILWIQITRTWLAMSGCCLSCTQSCTGSEEGLPVKHASIAHNWGSKWGLLNGSFNLIICIQSILTFYWRYRTWPHFILRTGYTSSDIFYFFSTCVHACLEVWKPHKDWSIYSTILGYSAIAEWRLQCRLLVLRGCHTYDRVGGALCRHKLK